MPTLETTLTPETLVPMATFLATMLGGWAYGAICSEAQGLIGHCPLCLPAAALTVISLAGGLRLLQQCGRD